MSTSATENPGSRFRNERRQALRPKDRVQRGRPRRRSTFAIVAQSASTAMRSSGSIPFSRAGDHLKKVDASRVAYDAQHGPPARVSVAERLVAKRRTTARR